MSYITLGDLGLTTTVLGTRTQRAKAYAPPWLGKVWRQIRKTVKETAAKEKEKAEAKEREKAKAKEEQEMNKIIDTYRRDQKVLGYRVTPVAKLVSRWNTEKTLDALGIKQVEPRISDYMGLLELERIAAKRGTMTSEEYGKLMRASEAYTEEKRRAGEGEFAIAPMRLESYRPKPLR